MKKILVFQHIAREHPSAIALYAAEKGIGLDTVKLWESDAVPEVSAYDGLIVLGGPMGVYEEYAGKNAELQAIQKYIGSVPMLGICLGAQLLAHALGARVYPHIVEGKRVKEIGYYDVLLTDDGKRHPVFKGFPESVKVLQWHGDTFDIPKGAVQLAKSPLCANQAFAYGTTVGLQFHVEAMPELVSDWLVADSKWAHEDFDLNEAEVIKQAQVNAELMRAQCYRLLDNFLSV